jgi:RNA polymerase sigma factor (sigma-70 family)
MPKDKQTLVERLVDSHGRRLGRFLLARVRNAADVPDVAQDVYLHLLRISDQSTIRSPEAYLFTVAQHVALQHSLRRSREPVSVDLDDALNEPSWADDPVAQLDADQCVEEMQRALDRLSPTARAVFMLHRRDGLSMKEISVRLGISHAMTKKHIVAALTQFRHYLER